MFRLRLLWVTGMSKTSNGNDSLDYVINGPSEEELKAMRSLYEDNNYDSIHISE